jgi:hypothetical protein
LSELRGLKADVGVLFNVHERVDGNRFENMANPKYFGVTVKG